jgi:hypothetical protein
MPRLIDQVDLRPRVWSASRARARACDDDEHEK